MPIVQSKRVRAGAVLIAFVMAGLPVHRGLANDGTARESAGTGRILIGIGATSFGGLPGYEVGDSRPGSAPRPNRSGEEWVVPTGTFPPMPGRQSDLNQWNVEDDPLGIGTRHFEDIKVQNVEPPGCVWFANVAVPWSGLSGRFDLNASEFDPFQSRRLLETRRAAVRTSLAR